MLVYKIRNTQTGLYSKGGLYPRWDKKGKIWKRTADLSNHIGIVRAGVYNDAEIIVLEIQEAPVEIISIKEYTNAITERRNKRIKARDDRYNAYLRQKELAELERLQSKYGK